MSKYSAPKLPVRRAAEVEQGLFDFLVPFRKPVLLPKEAALCIGRSVDFVRDLIQLGKLESLSQSAKGDRPVFQVTRRSVLLYLVYTANFDAADFQRCLRTTLESLDPTHLEFVIREATVIRARRSR